MLAKKTNGIPAYKRIQAEIRTGIDAGDLRAGNAVPSERELARIHDVSLMTARHALASLEREGLVERRRGVGTFVAAPKIHFNKLMSYTEQMGSRGLTPVSKVLFTKIIDNEEEATARLALPLLRLAIFRLNNFLACNPPRCRKNLYSPPCSAIITWSSAIPTKRSTPPPPTREPPNFSVCQNAPHYSASARSFIQPKALSSSMF
jgi:DNA-binding transcriptional regulator YhcF (GntR family)